MVALCQVKTRDWVKCEKSGKIYESMLKIVKVCFYSSFSTLGQTVCIKSLSHGLSLMGSVRVHFIGPEQENESEF